MWRLVSVGVFFACWQIGAEIAGPRDLPAPIDVLRRLAQEAQSGALFFHLGVTLLRVAAAFVLALPVSAPAGRGSGNPGGWSKLAYYRWHGSPRMYYSKYDAAALASLQRCLEQHRGRKYPVAFPPAAPRSRRRPD